MAQYECELKGDFTEIMMAIEDAVMRGSISAKLEDRSDFSGVNARCSVRVFERFSALGGNRVSMNVTLFKTGDKICLSAITSGGSQAMFFKINTFGEESFLKTIQKVVIKYRK